MTTNKPKQVMDQFHLEHILHKLCRLALLSMIIIPMIWNAELFMVSGIDSFFSS